MRLELLSLPSSLLFLIGASSPAFAQTPAAGPPPGAPPAGYAPPPPGYAPPAQPQYAPSEESRERSEERAEERAEAAKPQKNIALATNMLNLAIKDFGLEVGIRVADFMSINVNGSYWSYKDSVSLYGVGIGAQFFLTSGRTFKGLYIYPSISYFHESVTETQFNGGQTISATGTETIIGIGATVGYQWLLSSGLLFRVGGGLVHYSVSAGATATDGTNTANASGTVSGTLPNVDGHIGFAF